MTDKPTLCRNVKGIGQGRGHRISATLHYFLTHPDQWPEHRPAVLTEREWDIIRAVVCRCVAVKDAGAAWGISPVRSTQILDVAAHKLRVLHAHTQAQAEKDARIRALLADGRIHEGWLK